MSQSGVTKLIPKLRFNVHDRRRLSNPNGPKGRHDKIKKVVTALFKHERLEMNYHKADEARGYAERLIQDAIRYGDHHKPTMEMASYWIIEEQIIHKLFKVLAPRYQSFTTAYTKLWKAPSMLSHSHFPRCVLELRGNVYPSLGPDKSHHKNLIHNILLEEAKKVYAKEKALKKNIEELNAKKEAEVGKTDSSTVSEASSQNLNDSLNEQTVEQINQVSEEVKTHSLNEDDDKESITKEDSDSVDLNLNKMNLSEENQGAPSDEKQNK